MASSQNSFPEVEKSEKNSTTLLVNDEILRDVQFRVEKNLDKCEAIWRLLSDHQVLTDLWDYRVIFHTQFSNKPYFLYAQLHDQIIAVLPMEFLDMEGGYFSFFGGGVWNERGRVFHLPTVSQAVINKLYELAPAPCYLHSIPEENGKFIPLARQEMETYYLIGADLQFSFENLLQRMSKETRHSVKRSFRVIDEMNPTFEINNFGDIPELIALNKSRFGEDSTFCKPFFEGTIKLMADHPALRPYLRVISIRFGGILKSCALCGFYNNTYIYLASGSDDTIQNLPKYLIYHLILDAFQLQANRILMLSYDCGWKDRWRIDKNWLYVVEKL